MRDITQVHDYEDAGPAAYGTTTPLLLLICTPGSLVH